MKPLDERGETLIAEARELTLAISQMRARLEKMEKEIDAYFPGAASVEYIPTDFATAHRVLEEHITLDPAKADQVLQMLGSSFYEYFTVTWKATATPECKKRMANADSYLGQQLQEFVKVDRRRHFAFTPGRARLVIDIKEGP